MQVIKVENFAVMIPDIPTRYRANCHKEWGVFVNGKTKGMTFSKAEKSGYTFGSEVEMSVCAIKEHTLTFPPHFIDEKFTEIWGIPVSGTMKERYPDNASELVSFMVHRQSRDKFKLALSQLKQKAFIDWVSSGSQGDHEVFIHEQMKKLLSSSIFKFSFEMTTGEFGDYHYVKTELREPKATELLAVEASSQINQLADILCVDHPMIENQKQRYLSQSQDNDGVIDFTRNKQKTLTATVS
jgi:hypothetical protein